jgi:hypothetical protein
MLRLIASLTLLVAQTATWVGGLQFECVDSAGSVCVDGGPRSCHCCDGESSAAPTHECGGHDHDEADVCDDLALSQGDCDCEHELLVNVRPGNVQRSTGWTALHDSLHPAVTYAGVSDAFTLSGAQARRAAGGPEHAILPLILLSPVALRC